MISSELHDLVSRTGSLHHNADDLAAVLMTALARYHAGPPTHEVVGRWSRLPLERKIDQFIDEVSYTDAHLFLEKLLNWEGVFEGKDFAPRWAAIAELASMVEEHQLKTNRDPKPTNHGTRTLGQGLGLDHFVHLADVRAFAERLGERSAEVRKVAQAAESKASKFVRSNRAMDRLNERRLQYPDLEDATDD